MGQRGRYSPLSHHCPGRAGLADGLRRAASPGYDPGGKGSSCIGGNRHYPGGRVVQIRKGPARRGKGRQPHRAERRVSGPAGRERHWQDHNAFPHRRPAEALSGRSQSEWQGRDPAAESADPLCEKDGPGGSVRDLPGCKAGKEIPGESGGAGGAALSPRGAIGPAPLRSLRGRTAAGGSGQGAASGPGDPPAGRAHQGLGRGVQAGLRRDPENPAAPGRHHIYGQPRRGILRRLRGSLRLVLRWEHRLRRQATILLLGEQLLYHLRQPHGPESAARGGDAPGRDRRLRRDSAAGAGTA